MAVSDYVKKKSCFCYVFVLMVVNFLFLSSLSLWLTPTQPQWFPKHVTTSPRPKTAFVQTFSSARANLNRTLKIVLWTPLFGDPNWAEGSLSEAFSSCPVSNCVLTKDKSDIVTSDAVLFHAIDLWNKFLGYSLPEYRRLNQVWILQNQESPPQFPINYNKYNGVFNWTATYRRDADVQMPYFRTKQLSKRKDSVQDVASTKSAGIAWVASNCADDSRRQMLVREINKYFPVDSYGQCGDMTLPKKDEDTVLKKYKFYLSFENSYCRDYITEKFSLSLLRYCIPIVSSGGDYKLHAPPYSYIAVEDFNSVKELTEYLRYLDQNNTAYNNYFDWTRDYRIAMASADYWCQLCEALHDERRPFQVYSDLAGYIEDDTCLRWTIPRYVSRTVQGWAIKLGLV